MADSGSNGKKGKGFAGLDSMVSDVSADVNKAAKSAPPKAPLLEPPPTPPEPPPPPERPTQPSSGGSAQPSGSGKSGLSGLGWVIVGVVVLVIWIANSGSGNKSQPPQSYSPPPSYSAPPPAAVPSPPPAPISDTQMPPVGRNNVLSVPQIRYCKREQIRIEAIESVINNAYDHEVNRFNAMVGDYNSRCGEFRYRRGNVELVERELASERASIASGAKSEWVRGSLGLKSPAQSAPAKPAPSARKEKTAQGTSCGGDGKCVGSEGGQSKEQTAAPRQSPVPSFDSLSHEERDSIESACGYEKRVNGPAAYNNCVAGKLSALRSAPRNVDLSPLTFSDRESIERACGYEKRVNGPAAYYSCLSKEVRQFRR